MIDAKPTDNASQLMQCVEERTSAGCERACCEAACSASDGCEAAYAATSPTLLRPERRDERALPRPELLFVFVGAAVSRRDMERGDGPEGPAQHVLFNFCGAPVD